MISPRSWSISPSTMPGTSRASTNWTPRCTRRIIGCAAAIALTLAISVVSSLQPAEAFCGAAGNPHSFCDHFESGMAERWIPEGGQWTVVDGEYVGMGTFPTPGCTLDYG